MRSAASPLVILVAAGCAAPPAATVANTAPSAPEVAPEPAEPAEACPLLHDELVAPARVDLLPLPTLATDDCPNGFDPKALLGAGGCAAPACTASITAAGARVLFVHDEPAGSGRFAGLGVVVDGPIPTAACVMTSSVGWRHLVPVAHLLAPLPRFEDVDGDGHREVIAWQRLPWGSSEAANGLYPVIYGIEGVALVRRPTRGSAPALRAAAAYRALLAEPEAIAPDCYRAMIRELER